MFLSRCLICLYIPLWHCALLGCVAAEDQPWPSNVAPIPRDLLQETESRQREHVIGKRLQTESVVGMRKMSSDPDEKFYLHYWVFYGDDTSNMAENALNSSFGSILPPALAVHADTSGTLSQLYRRGLGALLQHRDFMCPSGTEACTSINQPYACCATGSTCQIVQDTGMGNVGCCPASETCAGTLSLCPAGYSSCPSSLGGGCCLPGYACFEQGCVLTSTTTVIVTVSPTTATIPSVSSILSPSVSTTVVVVTPTPSTSPNIPITSVSSTLSTSTALVCSTGYRSCPATLGGGCCPTDRACGSPSCPELTSSATPTPPVRPTTDSSSSSAVVTGCPTGFYACSAYYQGGCCQVGRNCARTNCPSSASTTIVDTNGVTAAGPTGSYLSTTTYLLTGHCASGWSSCAAGVGGGCCPTGYACGTATCSPTVNGLPTAQGKMAPSEAPVMHRLTWSMIVTAVIAFIAVIFL